MSFHRKSLCFLKFLVDFRLLEVLILVFSVSILLDLSLNEYLPSFPFFFRVFISDVNNLRVTFNTGFFGNSHDVFRPVYGLTYF